MPKLVENLKQVVGSDDARFPTRRREHLSTALRELPTTTSHSYILLSYMYHKLRENSKSRSYPNIETLSEDYRGIIQDDPNCLVSFALDESRGVRISRACCEISWGLSGAAANLSIITTATGIAGAAEKIAGGVYRSYGRGGNYPCNFLWQSRSCFIYKPNGSDGMHNYHLNTSAKDVIWLEGTGLICVPPWKGR